MVPRPPIRTVLSSLVCLVLLLGCSDRDPAPAMPFFTEISADHELRKTGLRDRVEVLYDELGIPHIYAVDDRDAMWVQGYVTARDRFFQMDMMRKAGSGRITEVFGHMPLDEVLAHDIEMRRIMMTERGTMVFEEQLAALEPRIQDMLRAYSAGVNQWMVDAGDGRYGFEPPLEYQGNPLLSPQDIDFADVAPWTEADTFALGRYMQWNLSGSLGDELYLGHLRLATASDPALMPETIRYAPPETTVTIPDFFDRPPFVTAGSGRLSAAPQDHDAPLLQGLAEQLGDAEQGLLNPGRAVGRNWPGSNNWVVGPELTGKNAMLANDPHLTMVNPALFFHTHINTSTFGTGGWNAIGVTFPGVPALLQGHNEQVAWGVTTLGYDVLDLYVEDLVDDAVTFRGEPVPVSWSTQTFRTGVAPDAEVVTVDLPYVPHHGAVVSGEAALEGDADARLITMKWTGREPTADFHAFFGFLSATDVDDFGRAAEQFKVGAQSIVAADVAGNIAYFGYANVPHRPWLGSKPYTPDAPMPGTGAYEWEGYLPLERLVQDRNPAQGYIGTANQDIVGTTLDHDPFGGPEYYWFLQDDGFRMSRIDELLRDVRGEREGAPVTLDDMKRIQNDVFSLQAERVLPHLLDALADADLTPRQSDAVDYLDGWQFETPTGVGGPVRGEEPDEEEREQAVAVSIYFTLERILVDALMAAAYADQEVTPRGSFLGTRFMIHALENGSPYGFTDRPGQVQAALDEALDWLTDRLEADMSQWQWGRLHQLVSADMVGMATGLNSANPLGPTPNAGAGSTVDVAGWSGDGFTQSHGAQMRFLAEMEEGAIVSRSIIPGGQSGIQGDPHSDDQWGPFIRKEILDYRFYLEDVRAAAQSRWVFLPR